MYIIGLHIREVSARELSADNFYELITEKSQLSTLWNPVIEAGLSREAYAFKPCFWFGILVWDDTHLLSIFAILNRKYYNKTCEIKLLIVLKVTTMYMVMLSW